ncbi:MAG: class I SAM-dependent methyltransferase [Candidatus Korobacteraceae bacterium]
MSLHRNESESVSLRERIAEEISRSGPIPFSRYMELCLYEPELGYYSRAREQFGKTGDFYTSSDVHAVFGRLLARQFEEMWRALDSPARIDLIELGPGRGLFARDVLDWSAKQFPEFSRALHYALVEQSAHLRTKLRERLQEHIAAGDCEIFDSLEASASRACDNIVVFANEFFDALPVDVIDSRGAVRVGHKNGRFTETFVALSAAEDEFLDRYGVRPEEGERVEISLASLGWMERIARVFDQRRGFLILIDYGYTREEQFAGRHRDTIMSYRQHTASASPYEAPGEQDITAHVNFTALQARAVERGLEPMALLTQSQFLIGIGEETQFADAFQDCKLPQEHTKVALQMKHLIAPSGMGETFQVLLMSHNVAHEKSAGLGGLKLAH